MKRTREDVLRLIAELRLVSANLEELFAANTQAAERIRLGASNNLDYAALGYTIHNIYGVIENACLRIVKFFENELSPEAWHRELLDRMLLEIPQIRPAFFTREEFLVMDELRAFRHVFRNLYNRPLDGERLLALQKKIETALEMFRSAVSRYLDFLGRLGEALEE